MRQLNTRDRRPGAGGTPGGTAEFLLGLALAVAAVYMLTSKVTVSSGYWELWGHDAFGLSLIPFVLGVGFLFVNRASTIGWLLLGSGIIIIVSGILMNLHFYFQPTSLFNTLLMLGLLAAGIGLIVRGLQPH